MSLIDICADLQTAILADTRIAKTPDFIAPIAPNGIIFKFGDLALAQHDSPPRIIWVPVPEDQTVEGPEKSGTSTGSTPQNPRQILTWRARIAAHCWGLNLPDAQLLATLVWSALSSETRGVYTPIAMNPGAPDNLQRGWVMIATFDVLVPIVLDVDPTATVTAIDETSEVSLTPLFP